MIGGGVHPYNVFFFFLNLQMASDKCHTSLVLNGEICPIPKIILWTEIGLPNFAIGPNGAACFDSICLWLRLKWAAHFHPGTKMHCPFESHLLK